MPNETAVATEAPKGHKAPTGEVLLQELYLHNFKGVKEFTLPAAGEDIAVFGDNATGKTTLPDAFWWLLGGKDSQGRSDFEVKRLDEDGSPEHHLDHEVQATLLIGTELKTFKQVYREKWVKKRGQADREFSGHTTDHFIDGVPRTAGEYQAIVSEIASEEVMRLLTDLYRFASGLHWKERRELLLEVCGDVNDEEVVASDPQLADLPGILEGRSLDDQRKVAEARRKEINEELDRIPVRIDEAERALPDVSGIPSEDELQKELKASQDQKSRAEEEKTRIESGGQVAEKRKALREVEASIQEAMNAAKREEEKKKEGVRTERNLVSDRLREAREAVKDTENEISRACRDIERLEKEMDSKREEWSRVNSETFEHTEPDTCAACGQALPEDKVEAARQKALEEFNTRKSKRLASLSQEGRQSKDQRDILSAGEDTRQKVLAESQALVSALESNLAEAETAIEAVRVGADTADLEAKKADLEAEIASLREGSSDQLKTCQERIRDLETDIRRVQDGLGSYRGRQKGQERIEELKAQEKKLASEFEDLERQLYLMDAFVKAKVGLLTDRIKLFNVLVNGGIEECCEVSYQGVPWGNLNHGAQINVGLDIIRTLQEHYGVALPVWVDQAESVTRLPDMDCQVIRLVVSPDDKQLRYEEVAV